MDTKAVDKENTIMISIPLPFRFFIGFMFQIVPFTVLCAFPFTRYFRYSYRKTILITTALILGTLTVYTLICTYITFLPMSNLLRTQIASIVSLCCLVVCAFWYFHAVKTTFAKKIFMFSFTLTSALLTESIVSCICNNLPYAAEWPLFTGYSLVFNPIVHAVVVPSLCLFLKYFYMPAENGMSAKENGYLACLSLFLVILLYLLLTYISFNYLAHNLPALLLYFTLFLVIFILYGVMFQMYQLAQQRHMAHEQYLQTIYQMDIRDEQYRRIYDGVEQSRKLRHNLKHHLLILQGFLDSGETGKAREYLAQYFQQTDNGSMPQICSNPVVNMLISHYASIAKERGIVFLPHINIPDKLSVQNADLSVLLGNLLENAIEAADGASGENCIFLNMHCPGKMLLISLENGFDGFVKKEGARYHSTKQGHRGLGIKSIAEIAQKYDGEAEFSHEGRIFHASVILNNAVR